MCSVKREYDLRNVEHKRPADFHIWWLMLLNMKSRLTALTSGCFSSNRGHWARRLHCQEFSLVFERGEKLKLLMIGPAMALRGWSDCRELRTTSSTWEVKYSVWMRMKEMTWTSIIWKLDLRHSVSWLLLNNWGWRGSCVAAWHSGCTQRMIIHRNTSYVRVQILYIMLLCLFCRVRKKDLWIMFQV